MKHVAEYIHDEMALARDLTVKAVGADADTVTYQITINIVFDRRTQQRLWNKTAGQHRSIVGAIKRYVRQGFDLLRPEDDTAPTTAPIPTVDRMAVERLADKIAGRYGD